MDYPGGPSIIKIVLKSKRAAGAESEVRVMGMLMFEDGRGWSGSEECKLEQSRKWILPRASRERTPLLILV